MKIILKIMLLLTFSGVSFLCGKNYGHTHRTRAEQFEMFWDNGRDFERGWSAYEQSMGVKYVQTNGWYGWICTHAAGNIPPGFTEEICATNKCPDYDDEITRNELLEKIFNSRKKAK